MIALTLQPLLERLEVNSRDLNQYLALFEASIESFNAVVGRCEANVRTARRRLGFRKGWVSRFPRAVLRATRRYERRRTRDNAVEVYNRLGGMIQYLANLIEERRIPGS